MRIFADNFTFKHDNISATPHLFSVEGLSHLQLEFKKYVQKILDGKGLDD
jgi:hypothetical protein